MAANQIRFGLIGLGRHGARYARHLLDDLPEAELVAICRRDAKAGEEFAAAREMTYYADYHELLADERLDAVAVVVPPDLNADICTAAARRRLHFVVEKPLAHTLTDARKIEEAARGAGIKGLVAQTLRFDSVVQSLKAHLPMVGVPHAISFQQYFEPLSLPWLDDLDRGGIILHTGVHSFDLFRFLTGREVVRVYCESFRRLTDRTEDGFTAMLQAEPGSLRGVVTQFRTTLGRIGRIEVVGEEGILVGDHVHHCLEVIQGRRRHTLPLPPPLPTVRECLNAFIMWVRHDTPPPVSLADGFMALAVVDACQRSAARGTPVPVF